MKPFEIVEHTADIGVRAWGRTQEELFSHMAQGMFSLIVPLEEIRSQRTVPIKAQAEGTERLLVAWLRELLYLFDTQKILGRRFEIQRLEGDRMEAVVSGEKLDPSRHHPDKEVKAVTYCDLSVTQGADRVWSAQVIFDI